MDYIKIRGARQHNLKNIDVDIPKNKLVVITGVSGSGKSSLAFDTIYAEGQRRYVESLSTYARQFLDLQSKPDVDLIEGLSPAISIEQKTTGHNPRSTVATTTEIYDYMRLLWARAGTPYSPATNQPIEALTTSQMTDIVCAYPDGHKMMLSAPIVRGRKGEYKKEFANWQKMGYVRVQVDGTVYPIEDVPTLDKNKSHHIDVVIDRLIIKPDIQTRVSSSIEKAIALADGLLKIVDLTDEREKILSAKFSCPVSGFTITDLEPRLFSFNNPQGACPVCGGLGVKLSVDPALVIPNTALSVNQGAIAPWTLKNGDIGRWYSYALRPLVNGLDLNLDIAWCMLDEEIKHAILYGFHKKGARFEGVIPNMERRYLETDSDEARSEIARFMMNTPCSECRGMRLKPEALCVKIAGKNISQITNLSISSALDWFKKVPSHLSKEKKTIAERILKEITERLTFLNNVGLGYLPLDRIAGTLSGGEAQRIRLASQIGTGLTGVLYVLDEPSIGLHQRDNDKLLSTLYRLRDLGNTVVVVEHDEDTMRAADYLLDIGPEAGRHGGHLVAQGTPKQLQENPISVTGQYLSGMRQILVPKKRRKGNGNFLSVDGATLHNLKNVSISVPLGTLTCVTGVSGGGKSSLVIETLYKNLHNLLMKTHEIAGPCKTIKGTHHIDKIIDIDQSPIGRTPRSNPATYTGMFSPIRDWFAGLPESKARGYKAGRFSFNVAGGRCEACEGDGVKQISMNFLPDVYVKCDVCDGTRYNRETLEIKYKDKSIADVLNMTVDEAAEFFDAMPSIRDKCLLLKKVGLGYMTLGQSAVTLSGGEAQRIKLAKELSRKSTGKTLYILDEPTTGLHFADIQKLLEVLQALVDAGNTVVIIEHNLDVIKSADYIIDMGPEGGQGGGQVVATGTPEQVAKVDASYTGKYLKKMLKN